MCLDPVSGGVMLAGLASQALSVNQQSRAAGKVIKARNRALEADAVKQKQLQAQANDVNQASQNKFTAEAQAADRAAETEKALRVATGSEQVGDYSAATQGEPVQVQSEIARQIAKALGEGKRYAKSSANLNSYGRTGFNNNLGLTDSATNIERINNFSRGNTGVLQTQLNAANQKGQGNLLSADILGGIGDIAMMYSLGAAGKGAGGGVSKVVGFKDPTYGTVTKYAI